MKIIFSNINKEVPARKDAADINIQPITIVSKLTKDNGEEIKTGDTPVIITDNVEYSYIDNDTYKQVAEGMEAFARSFVEKKYAD